MSLLLDIRKEVLFRQILSKLQTELCIPSQQLHLYAVTYDCLIIKLALCPYVHVLSLKVKASNRFERN